MIFFVVETDEISLDKIPMSVKKQINAVNLHHEYNLLKCTVLMISIVNALNKLIIPRNIYDSYVYNFYDESHVELFNQEFFGQKAF